MKLAVSGKGGVGKTTIAAALVKLFSESNNVVYAIDADPDVCLAASIGISDEITSELKPLVEMRELINSRTGGEGLLFSLNPTVNPELDSYCINHGNIRYLRMGGIKKGGSSCYCRENSFLNAVVNSLLLEKKEVVIMDMGAGIEHLSRGTARGVDLMLVVVEPSINSVNTARLVNKLSNELGIRKIRIIGNKIRSEKERDFIMRSFQAGELLGFINYDDSLWESAMEAGRDCGPGGLLKNMETVYRKILKEFQDGN